MTRLTPAISYGSPRSFRRWPSVPANGQSNRGQLADNILQTPMRSAGGVKPPALSPPARLMSQPRQLAASKGGQA